MKELLESIFLSVLISIIGFFLISLVLPSIELASLILVITVIIHCTRLILEKLNELKKELSQKDESFKTTKIEESL